jgi:3',5'-cyclic AMP phosphodiesterase CpdA
MKKQYTIAHLSDLHLTSNSEGRRKEDKKHNMNANLVCLLNDTPVQEADLVVVTGDITDKGESSAWDYFWSAVKSASLNRKKILVIHGNHDVACLDFRRRKPKEEYLAIVKAGLRSGGQKYKFPYVRTFCDGEIGVFCVDSVNAGNFNVFTNAVGSLGFEQLYKLGRLIRDYDDIRCKLIVLHHSPNIPKRATSKKRREMPTKFWHRLAMQLERDDRIRLRLLARTFGVKAILHGHTHDNLDRSVNSVRIIGACDSTVARKSGMLNYKLYSYYSGSKTLRRQPICELKGD